MLPAASTGKRIGPFGRSLPGLTARAGGYHLPVPPLETVVADRYRLIELIGRGGAGEVWRARDERLQRDVAVKRIRLAPLDGEADGQPTTSRAMREARAAARLSHPGVVTIYDVVTTDEETVANLVMELVDAPDLASVVQRDGTLSPERAAAIGGSLLEALTAGHGMGILHRDVKPSNVLLPAGGRPRLTDFGTATIAGEDRLTASGIVVGSPAYMSPEQALGEPVDPRTDLWSLGATLFHAVEGHPPFGAGSPIATARAVTADPPRPAERAGALAPLLAALLTKDPDGRPGVEEVRAALAGVAAGTSSPADIAPVPAGTMPVPADTMPMPADTVPTPADGAGPLGAAVHHDPARRRRRLVVGGAMALVVVLGVVVIALGGDGGGDPTTSVAAPTTQPPAPADPDAVADAPVPTPSDEVTPTAPPTPVPTSSAVPTDLPTAEDSRPDEDSRRDEDSRPDEQGEDDDERDDEDGDDERDDERDEGDSGRAEFGDGTVPEGWQTHQPEGAPYTVSHPADWVVEPSGGTLTDIADPNGPAYLRLDWTDDPAPDPVADWEAYEEDFAAAHPGYERLRLEPTTFNGEPAAIWEYRYAGANGTLHAYNLNVSGSDYGYALNFQTSETRWADDVALFEGFTASYAIGS